MWNILGALVDKQIKPFVGNLENANLAGDWKEAIKNTHPKAAPYTRYADIRKDTLYIRVEDSIWIGELEFYKENLKKELNKKRKTSVLDIKFTLSD